MARTNEEKLDLFADLLEPVATILSDKELSETWRQGKRIRAIRQVIKAHKAEVVEVLARIEGVEPETYTINGMALLLKLTALMNRPDVNEMVDGLFTSQDRNGESASSGPAMETIGGGAQ